MMRGERIDVCPICDGRISDIGFTHINSKKGHIKYDTAKCLQCNVDLTDRNRKWTTSWLEYHNLDTEIDLELAKDIYQIHELNNQDFIARIFNWLLDTHEEGTTRFQETNNRKPILR